MAVPDFQSIMLPLLKIYEDGHEHSNQETVDVLSKEFSLSEEDVKHMLPSGKQTTFYNRAGWARTYLTKSGLLEMPRRSYYQITKRGQEVLASQPARIDMKYLERFPEYRAFKTRKRKIEHQPDTQTKLIEEKGTPEEILEEAYQEIRDSLAQDVLENIMNCSASFFERLVVELLVKMGYGGSRKDAARAVGQTGDEGIDGIIDEDRLGLDTIYIQAKRWENVVGRPEIQKFVGALMGKRARKGIFITTSRFSSEAIEYVMSIDFKVVLIDGERLADFMIDYDLGVTGSTVYQLKKIDTDYFVED